MIFKAPAGMKDILPEEAFLWQNLEEKARKVFTLYGYLPIRTPEVEYSSLFNRSLGQETEVVKKQMFLIQREEETYCLRPEATAAVVRAYIENGLDKTNQFSKLYYLGAMFRAERPQKGRFRQFHHIGVEALGAASPYLDAEVIALAIRLLDEFGISGYQLKLNSLGCRDDRKRLSDILRERLAPKREGLCPDCRDRFNRNIFRVLDCKNEGCKDIVCGLKLECADYLCQGCLKHFAEVKERLDNLGLGYSLCGTLVRGLDYYTGCVFEISHCGLGAQDALGAGGRYDNLIQELGGPNLGAVGFALGVERLLLAAEGHKAQGTRHKIKVFVVTLGEEARKKGFELLDKLRRGGVSCDMDYENKSLKGQMRRANDLGAGWTAIIGDDEIKKGMIALKDMQAGSQAEISLDNFVEEVKRMPGD